MKPRRDSKPLPSATALVSDAKGVKQGCCYCGKDHFHASCDVVPEVDARKQILRKSGRCFSCLHKWHLSRNCRTTHRCHKCNRHHHTSICTAETSSETTPVVTTNTLNLSAPEYIPSTTDTTLYLEASRMVLLQTAVAEVYHPTNQTKRRSIRIAMDSGSQRSYLTTKVKQDLRLEAVSTQRLSIAAFGSRRTPAKPCNVVNLTIRTRFGPDLEVSLFMVPHICDPLSARPVSTGYQHLSGLNLADHCSESEIVEVDLLIGSDVY